MFELNVHIIKPGSCTVDPGRVASALCVGLKHQLGVGGGSTVILVRDGEDILLVDTGYDKESDISATNRCKNQNRLEVALAQQGVSPQDVTKVFITHFHRDHYGGIEVFEQAQWYCHLPTLIDFDNPLRARFVGLDNGAQVTAHTNVVATPGHTKSHASLIWSNARGTLRVAICGDAILSLPWLMSGVVWRFNSDFFDENAARDSSEKLFHMADIMIPGHGEPFFASV